MKAFIAIFSIFLIPSTFANSIIKLRDGSELKVHEKNIDVVDGLASLGQNLFIIQNKQSKEKAILTTHFAIRKFQNKNAKDSWCEGNLEKSICITSNQDGKVYSILSPNLTQGVGTIHSITINNSKKSSFAISLLQNITWVK